MAKVGLRSYPIVCSLALCQHEGKKNEKGEDENATRGDWEREWRKEGAAATTRQRSNEEWNDPSR